MTVPVLSENVYMMSLVDENDLAEFLDENEETEKKEESAVVSSGNDCSTRTRNYRTARNRSESRIRW